MSAEEVDFTGVEGRTGPVRIPEGNYALKITKCDQNAKGKNSGNRMWVFTLEVADGPHAGTSIQERCVLIKDSLFRLRSLIEAAGYKVPPQKMRVDPQKNLVGKTIGAYIRDGEPYGKNQTVRSEVGYYVSLSEVKANPAEASAVTEAAPAPEPAPVDALLDEAEEDALEPSEDLDEEEYDDEELDEEEDEEPAHTAESLKAMPRPDLLKLAKELKVPRTKGKHTSTYITEILLALEEAEEADDEESEPKEGDDEEMFSLDDLD